jgi:hypothetical protein
MSGSGRILTELSGRTKNLTRLPTQGSWRPADKNPRPNFSAKVVISRPQKKIVVRLRQRFYSVDKTMKASHLLRYSTLKQQEGESGADFVDRKQREYTALREMGINVDDSLRLTKFIQQETTNSKHKSLAQTIFTTPNMTLSLATSLLRPTTKDLPLLPLQHRLSTHSSAGTVRKRVMRFSPVQRKASMNSRKRKETTHWGEAQNLVPQEEEVALYLCYLRFYGSLFLQVS